MGRVVAPCKLGLNATSGINPIDYLEWGARVKGNAEYSPNKHSNYVCKAERIILPSIPGEGEVGAAAVRASASQEVQNCLLHALTRTFSIVFCIYTSSSGRMNTF